MIQITSFLSSTTPIYQPPKHKINTYSLIRPSHHINKPFELNCYTNTCYTNKTIITLPNILKKKLHHKLSFYITLLPTEITSILPTHLPNHKPSNSHHDRQQPPTHTNYQKILPLSILQTLPSKIKLTPTSPQPTKAHNNTPKST